MTARLFLAGAAALGLTTGVAEAEMSGNVIKIGVLNDQSGIYSDLGGQGSVVAAQMAAEEFGGEINGARIEIVSADHQNRADIGSSIAREWIDVEGVDVITDVPNSAVALAVQGVTREKGTAFINQGAATTELTGAQCSPTGIHWAYDTNALAVGTGGAIVAEGGMSWFFITADYAFGHSLEATTSEVVTSNGGEVLGSVRHPLSNSDFSSFLLQAQGSGAQVIGLANAGGDTINTVKQANEFGIVQAGQKLAGLLLFLTDIHSIGLETAQGLELTTGFYWNMDEQTRAWAEKFNERHGAMPTMVQAGTYSGLMHYLNAVRELGSDTSIDVVNKMKEMPVDDFFARNAKILPNGRMAHDMYLARVKSPDQSEGEWDYYEIVRTIPPEEAFLSAEESGCAMDW